MSGRVAPWFGAAERCISRARPERGVDRGCVEGAAEMDTDHVPERRARTSAGPSVLDGCEACAEGDFAALDLASLDPSDPDRFEAGDAHVMFARLRHDAPVHRCHESIHGPYWSVTRYDDIAAVEMQPELFSSAGGITLLEAHPDENFSYPMFIAMDPPRHTELRRAIAPMFAPSRLAVLEDLIRARVEAILDGLPEKQPFDWVERVSVALTLDMLATLLGTPRDERHLLRHWSEWAMRIPLTPADWSEREAEMQGCLAYFARLRAERAASAARPDLISMLAKDPSTRDMPEREFLGNLMLLIVGGSDTTRHAITASILAYEREAVARQSLRNDPRLIDGFVQEVLRMQSPAAYMRRRAMADTVLAGTTVRAGDKLALWYVSANRDETVFPNPGVFDIARSNARRHLSFGLGLHRCVGARLAEMQLRLLMEAVLARGLRIELLSEPERLPSSFICGFKRLRVRLRT